MINCYSTGAVTYDDTSDPTDKGFAGYISTGAGYEMTDNFWDTETSEQTTTSGVATGKTTTEMKTRSTFTGVSWNFDNIWAISSAYNSGYPNLDGEGSDYTWDGSVSSVWNTDGNWDQNHIPAGYDNVTVASTSNDPVIGSGVGASCKDLTVNNGATLTVNDGGSLITNGNITNDGTIDIKMNATDDQWNLISIPVTSATANTFFADYLQSWDEPNAQWVEITNETTPLTPAKGYKLWPPSGKSAFTYTGIPNTGDQSIEITAEGSGDHAGMNFLGNPYPSYLDWDEVTGYGSKYTWNGASYDAYTQIGSYGEGSRYVAPMEGYFIYKDVGVADNFSLTNAMRAHTSSKKSGDNKSLQNGLVLTASNGSYEDELWLVLDEQADKNFELERDAWKLLSSTEGLSQLWSESPDGKLSIDVRPEQETIQLGFTNDETGFCSIRLEEIEGISQATIEDTKLNQFHNLANGAYQFDWNTGDSEERFILHLKATGTSELEAQAVQVYGANGQIYVNQSGVNYNQMRVYDLSGRLVYQNQLNGSSLQSFSPRLISGVYLVELMGEYGTESFKIVL